MIAAQGGTEGRSLLSPGPGRKNRPPFFRPVPGLANAAACYPRLAPWAIVCRPTGSAGLPVEDEVHRDRGGNLHGLAVEKRRLEDPLSHRVQGRTDQQRVAAQHFEFVNPPVGTEHAERSEERREGEESTARW